MPSPVPFTTKRATFPDAVSGPLFLVEFRMFLLHALPAAVSVELLYALIFRYTFEFLRTDCRFLFHIDDVSRRWRHLQLLPHCLKPPTYLSDHKALKA